MTPESAWTISVFVDGDKWIAVETESFVNIAESPCGFGDSPLEAIRALAAELAIAVE